MSRVLVLLGAVSLLGSHAPVAHAAVPAGARPLTLPPSWAQQDPADSLYRAARATLNDGDYERAAASFHDLGARYPRSSYAADALYYEAFSRYRAGGTRNLRAALTALDTQRAQYAGASTRGDAAALATRIRGALARGGDADAAAAVTDDARAAAGPCPGGSSSSGGDNDERVAALNALAQMGSEQATPMLQRVLARRDACSAPLRRKAVFLLSQQRSPETADALLRVVQTDPDREVREQAVFWLSQVHTPRAIELLTGFVNDARDPGLQEKAIFALSQQDSERGTQALRDIAERAGASEAVREKAIFWLGQGGNSAENAAFLRTLYGRLRSPELKEKVLFSLAQQHGPGNEAWLLDIAQNGRESLDLRKKAIFWASQSGVGLDQLNALYTHLTDRELREQLIFAYSQRREPGAVDQLLNIARHDADPELRKKAIFWLGQSRDPRAAQFLLTLLDR